MQYQTFHSVSPTASVQRRSLAVAWVLLLLTLQLGIFNPVGCLIHCLPYAHAAPAAPAPFAFFCLVPEQYHPISHEAPSTPAAAMSTASAPQAAYAFVLVAPALMTLVASMRVPPMRDRMTLIHHCEPPLVPPPQAL